MRLSSSFFLPALGSVSLMVACGVGPGSEGRPSALVSLDGAPLGRLPVVPRLALHAALPAPPEDIWLVRGRLSDKEKSQVAAGHPSSKVRERRIPLAAWTGKDGLTLAPLVVLEPAQDYTLLALQLGEVARLTTAAEAPQVLWRWGAGSVVPGGWVVHCAGAPPWAIEVGGPESALGLEEEQTLLLEPEGHRVSVLSQLRGAAGGPPADEAEEAAPTSGGGLGGVGGCVRFPVPQGARTILSPHRVHESVLEPVLLVVHDPPQGSTVAAPRVQVVGSAAFVDVPPALVELSVARVATDAGETVEPVGSRVRAWAREPSRVPLGQFAPGRYVASVAGYDAVGRAASVRLSFEIARDEGFFVLSEVLANPLGPEPESEWVEIVNIGRAPLSLEGYVLEDAASQTALPAVVLPAGAVGLVVGSSFVAGAGGDLVPAAEAIPIVVDALGDGLLNAGEALRLRAPGGDVVSEIPAQSAPAGYSIARRHLLAPDWETSFAVHAAPGASPGRENTFEEP